MANVFPLHILDHRGGLIRIIDLDVRPVIVVGHRRPGVIKNLIAKPKGAPEAVLVIGIIVPSSVVKIKTC